MGYFDRTTVKVPFLSDPEQWMELYSDLNFDEIEYFKTERTASEGLTKLAARWSLTESCDLEHVRLLKVEDIDVLFDAMAVVVDDCTKRLKKKKARTSSLSNISVKISKEKPAPVPPES
jgi:hypothetical protein